MSNTRVVIVDDHAVVRAGVRALLDAVDGIEVVGEAENGRDAIRAAVVLKPDVMVLDLSLPDAPGVEVARRIGVAAPTVGVVVLTMLEDDATVSAAVRAGVRGYVLKGADAGELVTTIGMAAAGRAVFNPDVVARALRNFDETTRSRAFPLLTEREEDVLELIAQGRGNATIAQELGVAPKTIGNHITNIFHKLNVATRAEAIVVARDAGLGHASPRPSSA